jgi:hypothetical protein
VLSGSGVFKLRLPGGACNIYEWLAADPQQTSLYNGLDGESPETAVCFSP